MSTTPTSILSPDPLELERELKEIRKEQLSGAWSTEGKEGEALLKLEAHIQTRIKRAIEITAILRRTNTGPAKAKTSRAKKAAIDLDALNNDLLS